MTTPTLERVRALAPSIRARADEIEHARRLPLDLVADLTAAGCFRMIVPSRYGGDELPLADAFEVMEELAAADGSTGWTTMIGSGAPVFFGLLPRRSFEAIYANGPDVIGAGALAPKGRVTPVEGGYCVSGQWPFASGCQHADWLLLQAVVTMPDGRPELLPNGVPAMRIVVFQTSEVEILDTWHVSGLRGTGSTDVRLRDVFCPAERSFSLFGGAHEVDGRIFNMPTVSQLAMFLASVAVGIARGALEDIVALAEAGKQRAFSPVRLSVSPLFQDRLGEADATLRAARALLHAEAGAAWAKAGRGEPFSLLERARMRAAGTQVANMATQVVDMAYAAGGGSSIYDGSPLQRRLRDIRTLTQHIGVSRDAFGLAGALLAGEEVEPMRLA